MVDNTARDTTDTSSRSWKFVEAVPASYSRAVPVSRRRGFWWIFRLALAAAVLLFVVRGLEYFANQPRERAQRNYSYLQRVGNGIAMVATMLRLKFEAGPDPYPATALPVFKLTISSEATDKLNASLPASGTIPQQATVVIPDSASSESTEVPAKVSYNGISINHWGMPWKSWRLELEGATYRGMSSVLLVMPRSDTQLENWLGNEMARRLGGILTPDSEFVHFRLNGVLNGVRLLQEPANQDFLKRRNLPAGKIFHGDITTAQIYDNVRRERLFSEQSGWELKNAASSDQSVAEIQRLINVVQRIHNPYDFYYQLPEVIEVDALLRYMALLEIVSSVHIDETHNWKLYLNPTTNRFEPIVFNTVAYYWKNTKSIDLAPNDLFRVVLSNPGLREAKDRTLWNALSGPLSEDELTALVTAEVNRIAPDMYGSYLKWGAGDRGISLLSNQDWDKAVQDLFRVIRDRHAYLRSQLVESRAGYKLATGSERSDTLAIRVASRSGLQLKSIVLQLTDSRPGLSVVMRRRGLEDLKLPVRLDRSEVRAVSARGGAVTLTLNDSLSSKRRVQARREVEVVPATYVYEVTLPRGVHIKDVLEVSARNSITAEAATISRDESIEIPATHRANSVWWSPEEFLAQ